MQSGIAVGILGGTGYGAGELLRLLAQHPAADVVSVVSSSQAGQPLHDAHPQLRGIYSLTFSSELAFDAFQGYSEKVLFAALPHGVTASTLAKLFPDLEKHGVCVIDLSGDFRLREADIRERFYPGTSAVSHLQTKFCYGLTELTRQELRSARAVSNPGCLATACVLAVQPLISSDFSGELVFDAKTGSSGAGRSLSESFHHAKRSSNFAAYKMLSHRHEPEILQGLGDPRGERIRSAFVPHLLPSARGIFITAYLRMKTAVDEGAIRQKYEAAYQESPFIRLVVDSPELQAVLGSNFCDISVSVRGEQVVAMAALDNMVKGMAGQAIQNMNVMLGLPETTGLWMPGLGPI